MTMPLFDSPNQQAAAERALGLALDPTVLTDLRRALESLRQSTAAINMCWRYYEGDHPRRWMTDKMREMFADLADQMMDNYCEGAVDHPLRRLEVTGWEADEDAGDGSTGDNTRAAGEGGAQGGAGGSDQAATQVWEANGLDLEQVELYRHALVAGEAYVIVWPGEDDQDEVFVNDARNVYYHTAADNPRKVEYAAKVWGDERDDRWRAVMYYEDEIVRLVGPKFKDNPHPEARDFLVDGEDPGGTHDYGRVPVVRFGLQRNRRVSRLRSLTPIQDKINKLSSNKMVAGEFGAFKQRWYLTTQAVTDGDLRNAPDAAIILDPGEPEARTQVGEFSATELSNYDVSIAAEIDKFFEVANLPKHLRQNPGADPSGDAIKADEGPFVAMLDSWVGQFTGSWRDVMGLLGIAAKPVWRDREVANDLGTATVVKTMVDAGVPVGMAVGKYAGWDDAEVEELESQAKAKADQERQAGEEMLKAFDRGQNPQDDVSATPRASGVPPVGRPGPPPPPRR